MLTYISRAWVTVVSLWLAALVAACTASSNYDLAAAGDAADAAVEHRSADSLRLDATTAILDAAADALLPSSYCEHVAPAYCRFYLRCGRMAVADEAQCLEVFVESCSARYEPVYRALVAAGLLELSATAVADCLSHLAQVDCSQQLGDLDRPCGMWIGQQEVGGACGLGIESLVCAPGAACVLRLDLCGTCRRIVSAGEPCGSATTAEVTCGPAGTCRDGECQTRGRPGEPCDSDHPCALGALCSDGRCAAPRYVGLGEPCDLGARRCPYLATCISGTCRANARLNASCGPEVRCDSGRCVAGRCEPLARAGAGCSSPADCLSGSCSGGSCDSIPGRCFE